MFSRHTHSDRLERWLGAGEVERLSRQMRDFYWPIPVHGVPGAVYAMPGGDFTGHIDAGQFGSAFDRGEDALRRFYNAERARIAQHRIGADRGVLAARLNTRRHAFTNLSAVIAAATGGKKQAINFQKTGTASNAIGNGEDLWIAAGQPAAGGAGAAAPGGTVHVRSDTGALGFNNPARANTAHFVTGYLTGSVIANSVLLYDRLFSVVKTMNSTATQAVTGVPTRYTNQTAGTDDYIGGNFCYPMNPTTVLPATAHNWTVCQYTDQDGNLTQSFPSATGVSACTVGGIDLSVGNWFMPLAADDVGVKALSQMQCSALVATGTISFVVAHPIAFFPVPVANMVCIIDGINTAFNLTKIYDNACLAFLEMPKPATTATTYSGLIEVVAE